MSRILIAFSVFVLVSACSNLYTTSIPNDEFDTLIKTSRKQYVEELSREVVIFNNVAFGLGLPLRRYLSDNQVVTGKSVLDLGAGAGVLSLIALKSGASKSVATDINPYAVANAVYNAERLGFGDKMDVRLVAMDKPGAYSVIQKNERFDFIVSNPPQHPQKPETLYDYSFADPDLAFLRSILEGLHDHLAPDGKGVFALYDQGLKLAHQVASEYDLAVNIYLKTQNRNGIYYIVEIKRQRV